MEPWISRLEFMDVVWSDLDKFLNLPDQDRGVSADQALVDLLMLAPAVPTQEQLLRRRVEHLRAKGQNDQVLIGSGLQAAFSSVCENGLEAILGDPKRTRAQPPLLLRLAGVKDVPTIIADADLKKAAQALLAAPTDERSPRTSMYLALFAGDHEQALNQSVLAVADSSPAQVLQALTDHAAIVAAETGDLSRQYALLAWLWMQSKATSEVPAPPEMALEDQTRQRLTRALQSPEMRLALETAAKEAIGRRLSCGAVAIKTNQQATAESCWAQAVDLAAVVGMEEEVCQGIFAQLQSAKVTADIGKAILQGIGKQSQNRAVQTRLALLGATWLYANDQAQACLDELKNVLPQVAQDLPSQEPGVLLLKTMCLGQPATAQSGPGCFGRYRATAR